jgi:phosphopantetheinyl transferase
VGRLPGTAGEDSLTDPLWHDGPLDRLHTDAVRPVVWSVRLDSDAAAAALACAPHDGRDLAEFAAAADAGDRLLRRRLTRALVGRLAGVAPKGILFGRTADGAPSILSPLGWYLSVAGRGPQALIGVSRAPIGVDLEPIDTAPPLWDMLTPAEAAQIAAMPEQEQPSEWLARWTAKEAHAKKWGCARRADPVRIETGRTPSGALRVRSEEGVSDVFPRATGGRIEAVAL